MRSFQILVLLCIPIITGITAHAETFHGINFSCTAIPQANLNDVTLASDVRTTATNISSERLVARYHVVITSSQERVEKYAPTGGGNFSPQAVETHTYTPFSKASVQDEFPKTCQFTQIQVCPRDPPSGFPKSTYYRPFIDGGKECKAVGNLTIALPAPAPRTTCTVITRAFVQTGDPYGINAVYAIGHDATNLNIAVANAASQLQPPNYNLRPVATGCGLAHGAIATSPKLNCHSDRCDEVGPNMFDDYAAGLASSKEEAERTALNGCRSKGSLANQAQCKIVKSW
jgi:hypothetical protein